MSSTSEPVESAATTETRCYGYSFIRRATTSSGTTCCHCSRPLARSRSGTTGKVVVRLGGETEVLSRPKDKGIDVQLVLDLRRMLTAAGYRSLAEELEA